jgi:hypothetical protein
MMRLRAAPIAARTPDRRHDHGLHRGLLLVAPVWIAAALLAACTQSPADKAREAAMELRSWEASLQLLDDAEAGGAVPIRFAADARRTLEQERDRAEQKREQVGR